MFDDISNYYELELNQTNNIPQFFIVLNGIVGDALFVRLSNLRPYGYLLDEINPHRMNKTIKTNKKVIKEVASSLPL